MFAPGGGIDPLLPLVQRYALPSSQSLDHLKVLTNLLNVIHDQRGFWFYDFFRRYLLSSVDRENHTHLLCILEGLLLSIQVLPLTHRGN